MNLQAILSTKEREKILAHVLSEKTKYTVNRTAQELNLSKGLVSKFFSSLVKEDILTRKNNEFRVQSNINTKGIKLLLNLTGFDAQVLKKYAFVNSAGLYGSFVKGENSEDSDIDIWVLVSETDDVALAKLTSELKRKHRNIKILYLTNEKIDMLKETDSVFYHALVFGSITVYGEGIG